MMQCNLANIAGSASLVLSTQCLLVSLMNYSDPTQSSLLAGAISWILKDGIGQIGGILYNAQVNAQYDWQPKRYRVLAAMTLDFAAFLEILSVHVPQYAFFCACVANMCKNVGFLATSASRVALHQAMSSHIGDITAKSGSQSILAGLIGTSLGLAITQCLDISNYLLAFAILCPAQQILTYQSVQLVVLRRLDLSKLEMLLEHPLSPEELAQREPILFPNVSRLRVGASFMEHGRPPKDLGELSEPFLITGQDNQTLLTFVDSVSLLQVIEGVCRAKKIHVDPQKFLTQIEGLGWDVGSIQLESLCRDGVQLSVGKLQ